LYWFMPRTLCYGMAGLGCIFTKAGQQRLLSAQARTPSCVSMATSMSRRILTGTRAALGDSSGSFAFARDSDAEVIQSVSEFGLGHWAVLADRRYFSTALRSAVTVCCPLYRFWSICWWWVTHHQGYGVLGTLLTKVLTKVDISRALS
jgi:hypothetical protein